MKATTAVCRAPLAFRRPRSIAYMHAAAVRPTIVRGMSSAPTTNRTIYAAAKTRRSKATLLPGMLLFGPQYKRAENPRKRKREEDRKGSFPIVSAWEDVSEVATIRAIKHVRFSSSETRLSDANGDEVPEAELLETDNVPTRAATQLFGVWNSAPEEQGGIVSVAVSGVAGLVVETQHAEATVGVRIAFSRQSGIPQPYLDVPADAEAFATIIGPSKPVFDNAAYSGFQAPKLVPVMLHIRERPEPPKPNELMIKFAKNVGDAADRPGASTQLAATLNRRAFAVSPAEADLRPSAVDATIKGLAAAVVDSLVAAPLSGEQIKTAAKTLLEQYIILYSDFDDEFPWHKLAQLPLGWETKTPQLFETGTLTETDYVCMGLTALRLFMSRDGATI